MADEPDEDELFEQAANNLRAVRQAAEWVRSSGAEAISAGLTRAETELRSLATSVKALHQRVSQQHAVGVRLEAAAAKNYADIQTLHQTVEALSRLVAQQAGLLAKSARKPPARALGWIGVVLLAVLCGGAVA